MASLATRLTARAPLRIAGRRMYHKGSSRAASVLSNSLNTSQYPDPNVPPPTPAEIPSRQALAFPCVDAHAQRQSKIESALSTLSAPSCSTSTDTGPEPPYARPNPSSYKVYNHIKPFPLIYSADPLPSFDIAYETWGTLSPTKDNAILLHTGLSASSHAASTAANPAPGWWEKFIGPGKALDTNQFFVICTNVLGGCYGSTGPSSLDPSTLNTEEGPSNYATKFPLLSIFDMVEAQFHLLDHLGIEKLYASVGSSMGAMQSLAAGWLHPGRVGKIVSISGTARSSPSSIAMRYAQRSILMADPNWNKGFYYDKAPPHTGMKLARRAPPEIGTITYRSGPEWEQRFGRQVRQLPESDTPRANGVRVPALCPDFLIETYLDHQSDFLFPVEQQREVSDALKMAGNKDVVYYELGGVWGHDTFLIDVQNVGGAIRGFLS
ncbi:hypothetical protein FRC00_010705 [Tulasnella sp. 408]|nr:hypothetical protein FRC00_010705 [Tulasnella sp. 408]